MNYQKAVVIYGNLPIELGTYIDDIIENDRRFHLKQKMNKAGKHLEEHFIRINRGYPNEYITNSGNFIERLLQIHNNNNRCLLITKFNSLISKVLFDDEDGYNIGFVVGNINNHAPVDDSFITFHELMGELDYLTPIKLNYYTHKFDKLLFKNNTKPIVKFCYNEWFNKTPNNQKIKKVVKNCEKCKIYTDCYKCFLKQLK
jgi:hypothetical protein